MSPPSIQIALRGDEHRRRRHGQATEPRRLEPARLSAESARFIVQLHQTQRRHFDLRLEIGGSLRGWAVPRGPSLDAEQKRLAVEVDDRSLDSMAFDASQEAGSGAIVIWDQGHWQPDSDPLRGLADGRLGFTLYGQRLNGRWSLLRTDMRGDTCSRPQWLLVKARDSWVRSGDVADDRPLSALAAPVQADSAAPAATLIGVADLQLPAAARAAPEGDGWLHEAQRDGYRLLIQRSGREVRLLSRNGVDWTSRLPQLVDAVRALRCRAAVLDAELVALDAQGRSDLARLQQAMGRDGDASGIGAFAFDLLALDRRDLRRQPQLIRKRELARLLAHDAAPLQLTAFTVGDGPAQLRRALGEGREGIVSRRCDAPYQAGYSSAWLAVSGVPMEACAVIGYVAAADSLAALGALLIARPGAEHWHFAGCVASGFDAEQLAALPARLKPRREPPPLDRRPTSADLGAGRPVWVAPTMIVEARYDSQSADGLLQRATLKAIREDRSLADLQPVDAVPPRIDRRGARLSAPERMMFADPPLNRRDLAAYYGEVAVALLPGLRNRPLALLRCPDGIGASCDFERHLGHGFPRSVHETRIAGRHGRSLKVMYVDDVDGLLGLIEMGTIEIHAWGAGLNDIEHPDQLIFDLDPGTGVAWTRVVAAARELRDQLQAAGLQSFVRTSGGKGLHLLVPLKPDADWPAAKRYARSLARRFAATQPSQYTDLAGERNRRGRIFIDAQHNSRGACSIASYSLRARAGAPVATPLAWAELGRLRSASQHNCGSVPGRLARLREDPWAPYQTLRQTLPESAHEEDL